MANIVQLKRSSVAGKVPDSANLEIGELAINFTDSVIYSKNTTGQVIVVAATTTSNITEGDNLYFTNARSYSNAIEAGFTTEAYVDSSVQESYNQANAAYDRANVAVINAGSAFDTANLKANITDLTTSNVVELTNLYFTNNRVNVAISSTTLGNATFAGNVIASNINVASFVDFTPIPHDDYQEGRVFYDSVHKTINFYSDVVDFPVELGQTTLIRVYNATGNTFPKGAPITLTDTTATGEPKGVLADASSPALYNFSGLAGHDIPDSTYGFIVAAGAVRDFDTSALIEGERAFVGFSQPGTLVQPSPSYPNYPMCVGYVANSDATSGVFIVEQQNHSINSLRVLNDARVDGTLTVSNLTVLGSETAVTVNNLQVADTFVYLNSGDTANTAFVGTGLDDATFTGHYNNTTIKTFYVRIDGNTGPDTFEWSLDDFATTEATGVTITGSDQLLQDQISIKFEATTGHNIGDKWLGNVAPINLDVGIVGNRNTGTSGVGYTHMGVFFDVTDNTFKFFDEYAPEVEGNVNTGDASFRLGNVQGTSFIATLFQGEATSATQLATARNINLTGNVVGTASFDGTADISIATTTNTSNVPEGTNLYFTNARSIAALTSSDTVKIDSNGLLSANVVAGLVAGSGITIDSNGLLTVTVEGGGAVSSVAGAIGDVSNLQLAVGISFASIPNVTITGNVVAGSYVDVNGNVLLIQDEGGNVIWGA